MYSHRGFVSLLFSKVSKNLVGSTGGHVLPPSSESLALRPAVVGVRSRPDGLMFFVGRTQDLMSALGNGLFHIKISRVP